MEDAFALFDLKRRPLIDEAALKERYLRLAAALHPDISGDDEKFHLLQDAYKTLREPAARLQHLLDLEFPADRNNIGSAPYAELFMRAASAAQAARTVSLRSENTTSALARALLVSEMATALRQVREAFQSIQRARDELTMRLEKLDIGWPEVSPDELAALASSFRFIARWTAQLSEWEFRLSNG